MAQNILKPDSTFTRELMEAGGESLKKCYNLSETERTFVHYLLKNPSCPVEYMKRSFRNRHFDLFCSRDCNVQNRQIELNSVSLLSSPP